ncbi:YtxH domain-containing protein [Leucobacter sp. USHLN153]|uniref:YtxH domain-containing protein n=1 Tax=Leucobacter sp. USHLN153 TaxID=3081268 RepID=UPI0030191B40
MKGKIAFVLGAAAGYVLGSRAGRERYEQIKRGAEQLWNTAPVQRGADAVRDATRGTVDNLKDSALRAGKSAFASLIGQQDRATSGHYEQRGNAGTSGAGASRQSGSVSVDEATGTTANPRGTEATSLGGAKPAGSAHSTDQGADGAGA